MKNQNLGIFFSGHVTLTFKLNKYRKLFFRPVIFLCGWYCFESTVSEKRTHWASLSFTTKSVSSATNSVSSLWHINNRLRGTHWVLSSLPGTQWGKTLTEFGVWNRTLRNRIRPVSECFKGVYLAVSYILSWCAFFSDSRLICSLKNVSFWVGCLVFLLFWVLSGQALHCLVSFVGFVFWFGTVASAAEFEEHNFT